MSQRDKAFVLWLDEVTKNDVALVGGKNANLGEMIKHVTRSSTTDPIRVPFGFAVTAHAYRHFIQFNQLNEKIEKTLAGVDTANIQKLEEIGQQARQLIMGGSFPEDLTNEITAAYQTLAQKLHLPLTHLDVAIRSSATAEDLPDASFAGQQETYLNIRGIQEVLEHIKKAFASLFTNRAISYREDKKFIHTEVALSVTVQKMARSDRGSSGVAFTLDTDSGFKDCILINAAWGLGELVVNGTVTPDEYKVFKPCLRRGFSSIISKRLGSKKTKLIYALEGMGVTKEVTVPPEDRTAYALTDEIILQLSRWVMAIEKHYRRPMDIEWAYDAKTEELYIIQARPETVESRKEGYVLEEYRLLERSEIVTQGAAVGTKIGQGVAHCITDATRMSEFQPGEVLVTGITDPDWEPIMKIASAIVTDAGGRTSHAAIISRELGIPSVVGCGNATSTIKNGQEITVSCAEGEIGKVYKGLLPIHIDRHDLRDIASPRTDIKMIAADPELAFRYSFLPHKGVGLARQEFIISNFVKIHPKALIHYHELTDQALKQQIDELTGGIADKTTYYVERLSYGIAQLAAAFYPYDVLLRFSDFKSNEYANLIGGALFEPVEENPMLGWRGASRYYHNEFEYAFSLECQAIKKVREDMGLWNVSVMVPFCRTPEEGKKVLDLIARYGLGNRIDPKKRQQKKNGDLMEELEVWVMAEVPSNILQADEFAKLFDGFSIGSNDLTQLTLGLDRDSKTIAHIGNEKNTSVKKLIRMLIHEAHNHGLKVGICGQGPSDFPDFAEFLVTEGIDSISINPDTVLKATIRIQEIEKRLSA